ncbi:Alpha/Beta hydrolase protein [Aspergillus cavernicola]|uniref:Alpha/Beta hydrolase protein n=1 Tax=Aspergillus cavernicola TaxID=176166 RepID=A0ABR4HTM0_9EURO
MAVSESIITFSIISVTVPVILLSLFARRLRPRQEISLTEDLRRSFSRGLSVLPFHTIRRYFEPRPIESILSSNRFRGQRDHLCVPVSYDELCSGYWICKGPPGNPQQPKRSDLVLLWFHGGAYCFGGPSAPAVSFLRVAELAAAEGISMSIFSARYTLAPEAKFPRQQHEAVAAYRYLLEAEDIPADRIVIGGESAGGHLTLACLMDLVEEGLPKPGGALLFYPWVNLKNSSPSFKINGHKDILSKRLLERCVKAAAGERKRLDKFDFVDFTRPRPFRGQRTWKDILPASTWVNIGAHDILLHDVRTFVERAKDDGACVELQVLSGMTHFWNFYLDMPSEDKYCALQPEETIPVGMMTGSESVAEGVFTLWATRA